MDYDNYAWEDCTFPYDYCKPLYQFLKGKAFRHGLEIGFDSGSSALVFLAAQPNATLTAVDIRSASELAIGMDLLRKHGFIKDESIGRFDFIESDSHKKMLEFQGKGVKFDYIYIDGDHLYAGVKQDLIDALPLLGPDGTIILDDCMPGHADFGVYQAVEEIVAESKGKLKWETMDGHINRAAIITFA